MEEKCPESEDGGRSLVGLQLENMVRAGGEDVLGSVGVAPWALASGSLAMATWVKGDGQNNEDGGRANSIYWVGTWKWNREEGKV